MRNCLLICSLFFLGFACNKKSILDQYESIDIAIKNAQIIDGTGSAAYTGHIYIVADEIIHISDFWLDHDNVRKVIDAEGRLATPGFIDLHSHGNPLKTPEFRNFISMGVTTISLGQDGSSPSVPNIKDWFEEIENNGGMTPNLIPFVGHGTLRRVSGVGQTADPSLSQINKIDSLLKLQLPYVFGMSTGLEYNPGLYASADELRLLAKTLGQNDRMIMSHMRNEDDDQLFKSIDELLAQGQETQVHIAHLKSVYGDGEARGREIIQYLKEARTSGVSISADFYPYNASYTGISIVFPDWCKTKDQFEKIKATRLPELKEYLRQRVARRNGPEATLLGTEPYTGKTLKQVADSLNKPFEDVLIEDIGPGGASGAYFVMNPSLQNELSKAEFVAIASDGSPTGFHPRGHGTFARLIETMTIKDQLFPLETAIYKATGLPASILGIQDRGVIKAGTKADVIVFDPKNVRENSTYPSPHKLANGFDYVIINGTIAKENESFSDSRIGKILSK